MITIVGSVNLDTVARVPHLTAPGETVVAHELLHYEGGKGANQAVAAARAGSEVVFVGRVGDDAAGRRLRQSLAGSGVATDFLTLDPEVPTGTALITVDSAGENSIVVVPGANGRVSEVDVDGAMDQIGGSTLIVTQLEIPLDTVIYVAQQARLRGVPVLLNPAPAAALPSSLFGLVDILVANEAEVATLSGVGWPVDPASAARLLIEAGVKTVIVTLGARGAVVVTHDTEVDVPGHQVDAVDSTGAGDAFVGNLAHALDSGQSLLDGVRFATMAAALSVQTSGAQASMPGGHETERSLREDPDQ